METQLIDSDEVARRAGRSLRWVQRMAESGRLTAAQRVRGKGAVVRLLFDPAVVARELAVLLARDGTMERVRVYMLGLVRGDADLAEALWQVLIEQRGHTEAAVIAGVTAHRVRWVVDRYRGDVEKFVGKALGG